MMLTSRSCIHHLKWRLCLQPFYWSFKPGSATTLRSLSILNSPHVSSKSSNTDNNILLSLANQPLHDISLLDLVRHGRPPLDLDSLLSSANFTRVLLPVRLAQRIQALQNLPYIVVSNLNISKILWNYKYSLEKILSFYHKSITSLDDEVKFKDTLIELVETNSRTIPILAQGFLECGRYIKSDEVTRYLDEHLRARIGTRLLAEQHIALHLSSLVHQTSELRSRDVGSSSSHIGVLDTSLSPTSIINSCGEFVSEICLEKYGKRPSWVIDGNPSLRFAFVPVHFEYIITELLKNAFRATIESENVQDPVIITISALPQPHSKGEANHSEVKRLQKLIPNSNHQSDDLAPGVVIRFRDRGGGISPEVLPNIWSYSFTTYVDEDIVSGTEDATSSLNFALNSRRGQNSIAGLGCGLPLARTYAEYFGGKIEIQSLHGWGCDVYLKLRGLS